MHHRPSTPLAPRPCPRCARSGIALAALVAAALVAGLAPGARAQTGVWQQLPLPGVGALGVASGDSGTILVANSVGAHRFDGMRVRRVPIFSPTTDSLSGKAVLQAANGDTWLGTTNLGLFRLHADGAVDRYTAASGLGNSSNDEVLALAQTPDGTIWAGTNAGGLSRFDGNAWSTLTTDQGMPSLTVSSLAVDPRDGSLWAGTLGAQAGLVHVVGGAVAAVYDALTLSGTENVQAVLVTRAGDVWVGYDAGIARLVGAAFVEYGAGATVVTLAEGANGEIWFGTGNRGIGRWDVGALRILPSGPPSNTIRSVHVDAAGVLWTGTTAALARFEGAAWLSHSRTDGLPVQAQVFAALRDRSAEARGDSLDAQGITWLATTSTPVSPTQSYKLSRRAGGRLLHFGTADGLPVGTASALAPADSGAIWCATASSGNGGIARVRANGSISRVVDVSQGLPSGYVLGLADAGGGAVWAATSAGAVFVEAGGFRSLRTGAGALPDAPLVGVAVDAQGRAWFASGANPFGSDPRVPAGAVRFDPADSSYLAVGTAAGLPTNDLNGVVVAPNGDVWFATDAGAVRWRDGVVRTFNGSDGLPVNVVNDIAAAPDGTIWAGTDEGLVTFDGTQWSAYNVGDGLVGTRVVDVFADSLGVVASCRLEGVSLFHPDRTPPRVEIVSGPPPASGSSIAQFAVRGGDLDSDAGRVRISSELEGRAPTPFAEDVDAISLNLPDGDYVFRVRGKDRALVETVEPFEWHFTIDATPPRPVVQQPAFNAIVQGVVPVLGTIVDPRFARYAVELRPEGTVAWDTVFVAAAPPAPGASLFDWDTRSGNDGVWELRVGVLDSLGLIGYAQVSVIVDNLAPAAGVTAPAKVDHVTGGSVFTTNGEVELYVPPNAFAADQIVRIDPVALPAAANQPPGAVVAAWSLRANDPALAKPATLSIRWPVALPADAAGAANATNVAPAVPTATIARVVVAGGDTSLVLLGGAPSADGTRLATTISTLGTYAVITARNAGAGFDGVRGLDCQPRVLSPKGGGFAVKTAISFELGRPGTGAVKVYDRAGRLVKELVESGDFAAGTNVVDWDGRDGDGLVVPSGLYTVAVRFDGKTAVRTVVVANR